jgi:GT2 family glycosyltransferase
MGSPSVLIGIVTRNRAQLLRRAIRLALEQDASNTGIAVVDDASTDATSALENDFPTVRWTHWEQSGGLISARNYLMRNCAEDYFVSLDDDAWFIKGDEISLAAQYLEENRSIGAVAFDILSPDRSQIAERKSPRAAAMFIGCGHMIRLSAAREVGYYEVSPGSYGGEEKDLSLRLIDAGYEIVFLPGVHVWHDKTTIERHTAPQHRSGVCNDLVMTLRRTPLLMLLPALLSKFYRHWLFSFRNQLTKACLDGFRLFLRSFPSVWRSRKPVRTATLLTFVRLTRSP